MSREPGQMDRAGSHTLLPEVDVLILDLLPEEGERLGPHHLARRVSEILKDPSMASAEMTADQVAARLRALRNNGLAVQRKVMPVSRGLGWQKTPTGVKWANDNRGEVVT